MFTITANPETYSMAEAEMALVRLFSALSDQMSIMHFLDTDYGIPDLIPEIFRALESFYLHQQVDIHAGKKLYAYYVAAMVIGLILYRLHEGKEHAPEVLAREFLQFLDVKKYKVILL